MDHRLTPPDSSASARAQSTRAWPVMAVDYPAEQSALIEQAAAAAHELLEGGQEPSVAKRIKAGLAAAEMLLQSGVDHECVCAAILQGMAGSTGLRKERLEQDYGAAVAALVAGVARTQQIRDLAESPLQEIAARDVNEKAQVLRLEALRKMLLAMAQDVRVVLIVLAERVAIMRSLASADQTTRLTVAQQTMDLFAPLANRLGVWRMKWELEDLSFRFLEPERYASIARQIDERRADRERYIAEVIALLNQELRDNGIEAEISGRPKHIYSIHKKMLHKNLDFGALHDVRAARVLVSEVRDCYTTLGIVHNLWQPIPGEFDDYISHPKSNRYRSLHTAVIGPEGKPVEVQIRTHAMHGDSELGVAAHWRYKEGGKADRKFEERIAWLRQMLDWKHDVTQSPVRSQDVLTHLRDDNVYVLTPQGRVIDLPPGSTPVDFAYHVHTDLGHHCRGAKVDGHIVPLTYRLQNAQRVEITAAKLGGPSRDWLNPAQGYLHSPRALAKVRQWFKQRQLDEAIAAGRAILEKEMQRAGATGLALEKIAQQLQLAKVEDMLAAIGHGDITPRLLQVALHPEPVVAPEAERTAELTGKSRVPGRTGSVLVLGVTNIATVLARCCKPLHPEPIVGFVTKGRGVSVHSADCASLLSLTSQQQERLIPAAWGDDVHALFAVDIAIEASDRQGLLRDISEIMTREKVNVTAANTLSRGQNATMLFSIEVNNREHLNHLLDALRTVSGVVGASRRRG